MFSELEACNFCPRDCGSERINSAKGFCRNDASFNISSICIHNGEEPLISGRKGICNIFFSHCNLQCIYCQNYQISFNKSPKPTGFNEPEQVIRKINSILDTGINVVGFVSPSHNIPQVKFIIETLRNSGRNPVFVYNTNAYDKVETIKGLEGMIDVFIPDFKYINTEISGKLSGANNYPQVALKAIKEMYYQKGSTIITNDENYAVSGLIIRHLVLPGMAGESIELLRVIAEEISTSVFISLMSQYNPTINVKNHKILGRKLRKEEYDAVVSEMESLEFRKGWIQEFESNEYYIPDFNKDHPFED